MGWKPESANYTQLPANAGSSVPEDFIILHRNSLPRPRACAFPHYTASLITLLALTLFLLWPSDPEIQIVRVQLNNISILPAHPLSLDLDLLVLARVRNRDLFSLDYDSLGVSIGYRGRQLGFATSQGGHLKARASSYVNSTLVIHGFEVLHDIIYFIEDVARGSVPFDADISVIGRLGFLSLPKIPLKAKVGCEVIVNPQNQTVVRQNCYPE